MRSTLGSAVVAALVMMMTREAQAQPACASLPDEPAAGAITKIYIENGDTQEPLVKKLGKLIIQSGTKLRIVYRNRPTCNIRTSLFTNAVMTNVTEGTPPALRTVRYIPTDAAFDPTTAAPQCVVPDAGAAEPIVLGIGATYLSSCPAATAPADIGVYDGPIQAYGFITHKDSPQVAITAEEAYLAYGFTEGGGEAAPWVVQNLRFKRGNTASTTLTMASAMRLLPAQMKAAADSTTSELLMTSVSTSANPAATLGILGTELYDAKRQAANDIKLLAFKTFGQKFAYFPDKTNTTFDKQNVRDGHYLPWSPTPYIAKKDMGTGLIADSNVRRIYELVMGTRPAGDVDGLLSVVSSGLVPECAMKVTRAGDGADLSLASNPAPCGCYFEKNVPQGATTCTACTVGNDGPCNGGKCRLGYCEAK